jgi:hypothetical protein
LSAGPITYAFRNRKGTVGLLQVEETPLDASRVKVRYKLAQAPQVEAAILPPMPLERSDKPLDLGRREKELETSGNQPGEQTGRPTSPPASSALLKLQQAELEAAKGESNSPPAAGIAPPEFGPVIERVIQSESNQIWALNLASGNLVKSSREHPLDFRVGQADSLRTAKVDLYQPFEANTSDTLKALDMHLVPLGPAAWDTPANEAMAQLAKAASAAQIRRAEVFITGSNVYVFSTREGARGLLQIIKGNLPARLRYKLVNPVALPGSQRPTERESARE